MLVMQIYSLVKDVISQISFLVKYEFSQIGMQFYQK